VILTDSSTKKLHTGSRYNLDAVCFCGHRNTVFNTVELGSNVMKGIE
jgi:hypothetical protein